MTGCTISPPPITPPENYKGPIAERPVPVAGDYWVYEQADTRKVKGSAALLANIDFPLWVGKTWKYQTEIVPLPTRTKLLSSPLAYVDGEVTAYKQVTVPAGTFDAFEIKFQCTVSSLGWEPDCGRWTIWYAPKVKNIISRKREGTSESWLELAEYKVLTSPGIEQPRTESKPSPGQGLRAEKPEWKVGYEWKYAWKRPGESGTGTREIIKEDTFEGVPSWLVKVGRNEQFYTKDTLGQLAIMSKGKLVSKRTPPRRFLVWPVEVGKEWRDTYLLENIEEKSSRNIDVRRVVSKREQVTVPAGAFEAFKIETYNSYDNRLLEEHWYSPAAKWFVKIREYRREGLREEELMSIKVD